MLTHRAIALAACAALLTSCKLFDEIGMQDISDPSNSAATRVKFHNFAPSSVGVNFFTNDAKVSAISSTLCTPTPTTEALRAQCLDAGREVTTGTTYSNGAAGGLYFSVAPGQATLSSKIPGSATVVSTVSQTLDAGKYYTFVMSGIYNSTTQTAEAFVVEDPIPAAIDYTVALVRFVNAVPNGTGDLNLIMTETTSSTATNIGSAVAYKSAGTFMGIAPGNYNLAVRYTGSASNLISRTNVTVEGGQVYTFTGRGSTATSSTLGIDFTSNQR